MKFKKLIIFFIILFLSPLACALNSEEFDISKIPLDKCTFEKAEFTLTDRYANRAAIIAKNSTTILNEIDNIIKSVKKPHKPNAKIGDFLSPDELDKFNEANQRLDVLHMEAFIEGDLDRDLTVVGSLVRLAGDYYRDNKIPSEDNKDNALMFAFLALGNKELSFGDLEPMKPDQMEKCNLDYALYSLEIKSLNKTHQINQGWNIASAEINKIYAKYSATERKFEILSEADKNEVSFLTKKYFLPLQRDVNLIRNIELIRHYAKISQLRYESSLSDLLNSGGDISKTDVTMNNKISNGELSKTDLFVFKVWNVFNEKMPSWIFKQYKEMNDNILNAKNNPP